MNTPVAVEIISAEPQAPLGDAARGATLCYGPFLRFDDETTEQAFVDHYTGYYYRFAQSALILGLVLILGDFTVDALMAPDLGANFLRLSLCCPLLLFAIVYSFSANARKNWQLVMTMLLVGIACCLFWILGMVDAQGGMGGLRSWVGIMNFTFVEFYLFVILGVQFRYAFGAGLLVLAAFLMFVYGDITSRMEHMAYWSYHIVTLFILAAGIGWWRELFIRRDYLTQLAREKALREANAASIAKSTFLLNMSHEIRTPMNGILGMAHLMRRTPVSVEQAGQLDKIITSGRHLLGIINDILDLSRIEAGKLELEETEFRLEKVLSDLDDVIGAAVRAKGLRFSTLIEYDLATRPLMGDPLRLGQILLNLTGNALKFTANGEIGIQVSAVGEPSDDDGLEVRFQVTDTGIGMHADVLERIFEAFEQAGRDTSRHYGGTGLGLAINKRLVSLMGGTIWAESVVGQGSTFTFTATFQPVTASTAPDAALAAPDDAYARLQQHHAGARILIVDDEPINLEIASELLSGTGLQIDCAVNGVDALARAGQATYDLVLMDMLMPEMDGLDATRAIRALPAYAVVPVLAMTANAFAEDQQRCLDAGMNGHIAKPIEPEILFAQVEHWLMQSKVLAATKA